MKLEFFTICFWCFIGLFILLSPFFGNMSNYFRIPMFLITEFAAWLFLIDFTDQIIENRYKEINKICLEYKGKQEKRKKNI